MKQVFYAIIIYVLSCAFAFAQSNYQKGHAALSEHNVAQAKSYFQLAVNANAGDQKSQAMLAITSVMLLLEDDALARLFSNAGVVTNNLSFYNLDFILPTRNDAALNENWDVKEDAEYLYNAILPQLLSAYNALNKVTNTSIRIDISGSSVDFGGFSFDADTSISADYADILVLKSLLAGTIAAIYEASNYDVSGGPAFAFQTANFNIQRGLAMYPNALNLVSSDNLANAKNWLSTAISIYLDASYMASNRASADGCIFVLDENSRESEEQLRKYLRLTRESILYGPTIFDIPDVSQVKIDASKFFAGSADIRAFEPYCSGNKIVLNSINDFTFGGIFPDMTSEKFDDIFSNFNNDVKNFFARRQLTGFPYSLLSGDVSVESFAVTPDGKGILIQTSDNIGGDTNNVSDIYMLKNGVLTLLSTDSAGIPTKRGAKFPSMSSSLISDDGQYFIFISDDAVYNSIRDISISYEKNETGYFSSEKYISFNSIDISGSQNIEIALDIEMPALNIYTYPSSVRIVTSGGSEIYASGSLEGNVCKISIAESSIPSGERISGVKIYLYAYYNDYNNWSTYYGSYLLKRVSVQSKANKRVLLKNIKTGAITPISPSASNCDCAMISPDATRVLWLNTSSSNSGWKVTSLNDFSERSLYNSYYYSYGGKISGNSKYALIGSSCYDIDSGAVYSGSSSGEILDISYDGTKFLKRDYNTNSISVENIKTGEVVASIGSPNDNYFYIECARFSVDAQKAFIMAPYDGIYLCDFKNNTISCVAEADKHNYYYYYGKPSYFVQDGSAQKFLMCANPSSFIEGIEHNGEAIMAFSGTPSPIAYMKSPYIRLQNGDAKASVGIMQTTDSTEKIDMTLVVKCNTGEADSVVKNITISGRETTVDVDLPTPAKESSKFGSVYTVSLFDNSNKRSVQLAPSMAVVRPGFSNSGFSEWQNIYFTPSQKADASISGPNADPDGDLLSNVYEYAMGTSPIDASSRNMPTVFVQNGNKMGIKYIYNPSALMQIFVEYSTDLINWHRAEKTVKLSEKALPNGLIEATILNDVEIVGGKMFMRINVE